LTGSVQLDDQHGLAKLTLRAKEGDFSADVVPVPGGLMVSIAATDWKAPFQPPVAFAKFELSGRFLPGRFAIDKLEGLAYDGQVSGNGMVGWDDDASMAVTLNCRHLAAGKLLPALGAPVLVEGDMDGRIVVGGSAPTVNRLEDASRLDGSFHIARGSLKRYDLAGALRGDHQGAGTVRGGGTAFENFSGTLSVDARAIRLSGLRLSSGLMQATGQATVARQAGTITGGASVEMRGSTGTIRAPVTISGNVADPELTAGR
jgi:hypothetical protein